MMTRRFLRRLAGTGICLWASTFLAPAQPASAPTPPPALATTPAIAPEGAPKIKFASTVHDFGKVSAGEIVHADFVFTNVGSQTLEIKEVRPTCGCTTVGAWEHRIASGKTGVIPLQLNTANYSGQVAKFVGVTCNDPAQSLINLQIKGSIWKAIDVAPTFVMFNIATNAASNYLRTVKIISNLEQPLELSPPQVSPPFFRVKIIAVRPGKEFDLQIAPVTPLPAGNVRAAITIKTSATNLPVINITALAIVMKTTHPNMPVLNVPIIQPSQTGPTVPMPPRPPLSLSPRSVTPPAPTQ